MKLIQTVLAAALAVAAASGTAQAVTILGSSSPAYSGYGSSFALDNSFTTDFAGNGTGVGTHLDFDFGSAQTFTGILYTDRTSSGSSNGSDVRGITDYVTQYKYTFASDVNFTNQVATQTFTVSTPASGAPLTCVFSVPTRQTSIRWP